MFKPQKSDSAPLPKDILSLLLTYRKHFFNLALKNTQIMSKGGHNL